MRKQPVHPSGRRPAPPARAAALATAAVLAVTASACVRKPAPDDGLAYADPEAAEVVATVERLFEAMRTDDGELAASLFHPEARLGRATDQGIAFSAATGFVAAIGRPKEAVWDEPIWDWVVNVDGRLAQMWTKYAFYLGEDFSHCGSDAFELYKTDENGWQITQLVDTSRSEDCWFPPGREPATDAP